MIIIKYKKIYQFCSWINGQLFSSTNLWHFHKKTIKYYFPYYCNQTGNMGLYCPFEDDLRDRLWYTHTRQTHIIHTAYWAFSLWMRTYQCRYQQYTIAPSIQISAVDSYSILISIAHVITLSDWVLMSAVNKYFINTELDSYFINTE